MALENAWHDLDIGEDYPDKVTALIEIPRGSSVKYEFDKESGFIRIDRFLYSAVFYPGDYGFIPQTYCDDGDPLDVLIYTSTPVAPGVIGTVRILGVLRMVDSGEQDDKLIGVWDEDPRMAAYADVSDLPQHWILEAKNFMETYKILQKKTVKITAVEDRKAALKVLEEARALYEKNYAKG